MVVVMNSNKKSPKNVVVANKLWGERISNCHLKRRWEGIKGKEIGVCLFVYVYLGNICINKIYHFSHLIMYTILRH